MNLCANLAGQLAIAAMVDPPTSLSRAAGAMWQHQRQKTFSAYAARAKVLQEGLCKLPGVECNGMAGAIYLFPKVALPPAAIEAASRVGRAADEFYCLRLLNACGMCMPPGTCFGQPPGTFHFRLTVLPSHEDLEDLLDKLGAFHRAFLEEYSALQATPENWRNRKNTIKIMDTRRIKKNRTKDLIHQSNALNR